MPKLFLHAVAVAAAELVYATSGVDEFLFAGEEGVRCGGDLKFYERILLAIDFDGLTSGYCRTSDECLFVRHVFENNLTVVFGMNFSFHTNFSAV